MVDTLLVWIESIFRFMTIEGESENKFTMKLILLLMSHVALEVLRPGELLLTDT